MSYMKPYDALSLESSEVTAQLLYAGTTWLRAMDSFASGLQFHAEHNFTVAAHGVEDADRVSLALQTLSAGADAINLAELRDVTRQKLLRHFLDKVVSVEAVRPDMLPIHDYQSHRELPDDGVMGRMSQLGSYSTEITGPVTGLFNDGSFKVGNVRSTFQNIRAVALFGLGPKIDWIDAWRVFPIDQSGKKLVEVNFL